MRRVILAIVSTLTGLVLLLSFKTHGAATLSAVAPVRATATATATAGSKTVTGTAADTRYGPVQVQITVTNGQLTKATAIEYPTQDQRDSQINSYAIPILDQETVAAKSAGIDMVSGATYTSDGYLTSLQSALDAAGLA